MTCAFTSSARLWRASLPDFATDFDPNVGERIERGSLRAGRPGRRALGLEHRDDLAQDLPLVGERGLVRASGNEALQHIVRGFGKLHRRQSRQLLGP